MNVGYLVAGFVLSLVGLAAFFADAGFAFVGPRLPDTALGYAAWALVLAGVALLKRGASR